MARLELYGTASCPYTREMREWLELRRALFEEYDVDTDPAARRRLRALAGSQHMVPMLVENGRLIQVGWQGRGCSFGD